MTGRSLEKLREMCRTTKVTVRQLQGVPFQHQRISLPASEALRHASRLEAWLDDLLFIVEAELYHGPTNKE